MSEYTPTEENRRIWNRIFYGHLHTVGRREDTIEWYITPYSMRSGDIELLRSVDPERVAYYERTGNTTPWAFMTDVPGPDIARTLKKTIVRYNVVEPLNLP